MTFAVWAALMICSLPAMRPAKWPRVRQGYCLGRQRAHRSLRISSCVVYMAAFARGGTSAASKARTIGVATKTQSAEQVRVSRAPRRVGTKETHEYPDLLPAAAHARSGGHLLRDPPRHLCKTRRIKLGGEWLDCCLHPESGGGRLCVMGPSEHLAVVTVGVAVVVAAASVCIACRQAGRHLVPARMGGCDCDGRPLRHHRSVVENVRLRCRCCARRRARLQ